MDCEGCKFDALNESAARVLGRVGKIMLEYHRNRLRIVLFLQSQGFRVSARKMAVGLHRREQDTYRIIDCGTIAVSLSYGSEEEA
jgi:hypothetical protein